MGGDGRIPPTPPRHVQIRVDQAGLKHQRPKPTTLLSNMGQLKELDGITSNGSGKEIQSDLTRGIDLGVSKRRKVKYALIATIPVLQWPPPGETEISPEDPKVDPAADSKEAPKGGDEAHPGEEQPEAVVPSVEEEEADELLLDPEPKDLIPEAEAKKRNRAWEDFVKKEVHEIPKEVPVVNIIITFTVSASCQWTTQQAPRASRRSCT